MSYNDELLCVIQSPPNSYTLCSIQNKMQLRKKIDVKVLDVLPHCDLAVLFLNTKITVTN